MFTLMSLAVCVALTLGASSQQINSLPGLQEDINFKQYAGSVIVNETHGRSLFYWFVESQGDPTTDPVLLWLQGGPGCSSLGGFFEENGPFIPLENGSLALNPYSWNKIASVIYLESPSGVGFSTSNTSSDYTVGDKRTAEDSVTFLVKFFEMYPEFASLQFWVTGESYGGHYVPNLANAIADYNSVTSGMKINLQGFIVGNAWTDPAFDNFGATSFWYSHAIISEKTFLGMKNSCNFSNIGPLEALSNTDPLECERSVSDAHREMGNINLYSIYSNLCMRYRYHEGMQLLHYLDGSKTPFAQFAQLELGRTVEENPCVGTYTDRYLNDPRVQSAIHAPRMRWEMCNEETLHYSREDLLSSMLPVYKHVFGRMRILVYSGDVDGMVPNTGTRSWLDYLDLTVADDFHSWTGSDGEVAGYATVYKEMSFTTIRDAGHMVPSDQPRRALDMVSNFINGNL